MIELSFRSEFLSISRFNDVSLPDFTVLSGVNGSGKSHLLKAIDNKCVAINGGYISNINFFDYNTFNIEQEQAYSIISMSEERKFAYSIVQKKNSVLSSIYREIEHYYEEYKNRVEELQKSLWELKVEDLSSQVAFDKLANYRLNIEKAFYTRDKNPHDREVRTYSAILSYIKKLNCHISDVSEVEFVSSFIPYTFKADFLPVQLGKVFADYHAKLEQNNYDRYRNSEYHDIYDVLTDKDFEEKHGRKPWELLNEILSTFNNMRYQVNNPEFLNRDEQFQLKLMHTDKKVEVDIGNLSSGERVLMALVVSIYKSKSDIHFPELLLLDEIDASLHPSMIRNLLNTIKEIFIKNGVKVILVTHSPTTVALAPEESIYIMNPSGEDRIEKQSRSRCVSLLSEGFMTLEDGVKLLDSISKKEVSIFTEGYNTEYLKNAIKLLAPDIEDRVDVINGVEGSSGKSQLKTLYSFFEKIQHDRKIMFVWDCDVSYKLEESTVTIPFIFSKNNDNDKIIDGIENLFPKELFTDDLYRKVEGKNGSYSFVLDKLKVKELVLQHNNEKHFAKFQPFIDKLRNVLK